VHEIRQIGVTISPAIRGGADCMQLYGEKVPERNVEGLPGGGRTDSTLPATTIASATGVWLHERFPTV
jgi:hypothetical protein